MNMSFASENMMTVVFLQEGPSGRLRLSGMGLYHWDWLQLICASFRVYTVASHHPMYSAISSMTSARGGSECFCQTL